LTELNHIQQQKKYKILVIGDGCIDEYYYGTVERISPEAPVPIVKIQQIVTKQGMVHNVLDNIKSFGFNPDLITGTNQSIKRRFIDTRSKQHMLRVDNDAESHPLQIETIQSKLIYYDTIVISDYNKGFISYEFVEKLRECYSGPIFVDTKKSDLKRFNGCIVKINKSEWQSSISECENLIVTMGELGALYKTKIYPVSKVDVADVCGAGDTFLAALVVNYLKDNDIEKAILFANRCAALSVQHHGVYALTEDEVTNLTKNI
jgi:D-glycero-beta-D-manno-heptose-7-phosphate kinase